MTKNTLRKSLYWISFCLFILFIFSPICAKFITDSWGETWRSFVRPLFICSAVVASSFIVKYKPFSIIIFSIFMVCTICEWVMIRNYSLYMEIDHFMAFATTNAEESMTFVKNNLKALWYIIPLILLFIVISVMYAYSIVPSLSTRLKTCACCVIIMLIGVLPFEKSADIHSMHDFKAAVFTNTLKTPPLNIAHLSKITIRKIYRSMQTNDFVFNSQRAKDIPDKEIYVLAIGESVRYANCSLNGVYHRETMPLFAKESNLLFFHDYYSGGCTTSISVPMLVTRATAEESALSYQERSIIQVFNENNFATAVIKRGILSQISSAYLYQGVDYIVDAKSDEEVMLKVDSLSKVHDKLFVMFQLQGSHFYYDNFPEEFNKWRPNNKYDSDVKSDSLYINAYDNTILYTDFLLHSMIDSLKCLDAVSTMWYVSDHGQTITSSQGWHGSICDENEYHVPFCIWYSDRYADVNVELVERLRMRIDEPLNSDNIFYTICGMTHMQLPEQYARETWDVSSNCFHPHTRKIVAKGQIITIED